MKSMHLSTVVLVAVLVVVTLLSVAPIESALAQNKNDGKNKNAGNKNAGNKNAGNKNAGNKNNKNAGNKNAGNKNAGNKNAGNKNDGKNKNAGNKNAGNNNDGKNKNAGNKNGKAAKDDGKNGKAAKDDGKNGKAAEKKADPTAPIGGQANDASFCQQVGLGNAISAGKESKGKFCVTTVQGVIPSFGKMVSSIITSPKCDSKLAAGQDVDVTVRVNNMALAKLGGANGNFLTTPQALDGQGRIKGNQFVVVQAMNGKTPPNPNNPLFFAEMTPQGNQVQATVPGSALKAGQKIRICSMDMSTSFQPAIMPVAKRGAQADCCHYSVA